MFVFLLILLLLLLLYAGVVSPSLYMTMSLSKCEWGGIHEILVELLASFELPVIVNIIPVKKINLKSMPPTNTKLKA